MHRADRLKLLLIFALFAAPALAALMAIDHFAPAPGNSHGELLQPAVPRFAGLIDAAGSPAGLEALRGRWVLLTVASGPCDEACRAQVYLSRQSRLAQGRERGRVARALILPTGAEFDAGLEAGLDGGDDADAKLYRYAAPRDSLEMWSDGEARSYVVDPLGRVMLRFPVAADGKGMIRDLRLLLKASRIG